MCDRANSKETASNKHLTKRSIIVTALETRMEPIYDAWHLQTIPEDSYGTMDICNVMSHKNRVVFQDCNKLAAMEFVL